jgi:hypothetical protein
MINTQATNKPHFEARLFWDFEYDKINWKKSYKTIIARILERGTSKDRAELERYYGRDKVIDAIQHEIAYLPDFVIEDVCKHYALQKTDLRCYTRKLSRPGHWL